jgi:hypothetical protein
VRSIGACSSDIHMQISHNSRPRRSQPVVSRLIRLTVLAFASALAACAALGGRTSKTQNSIATNTAPEWLSHELGCGRAQLDYHWKHERYGSTTDTDSACVVLGRWGRPSYSNVSHFFDGGAAWDADVVQIQLNWRIRPGVEASIRAYKVSRGHDRPASDYFRIDRTTQPAIEPDTSHTGVIVGSVFDTLGYQIHRAMQVCAQRYVPAKSAPERLGCTVTSVAGTFRLAALPLGTVGLSVACETTRILARQLQPTYTALAAVKPGTIVMLVNTTGCDDRPLRTISRTFRGVWSSGFEMNDFSPCPADSWALLSDTLGLGGRAGTTRAWVTSLPAQKGKRWPLAKPGSARVIPGGYTSYVEWHGTVTGPGHYGHLGAASFEIQVDSVIKMHAPSAKDCK